MVDLSVFFAEPGLIFFSIRIVFVQLLACLLTLWPVSFLTGLLILLSFIGFTVTGLCSMRWVLFSFSIELWCLHLCSGFVAEYCSLFLSTVYSTYE